MPEPFVRGARLVPTGERVDEVSSLAKQLGGRVGLAGVLSDLNRSARATDVPGAAVWGFRWDDEDGRSHRWFPQGITTSADQGGAYSVDGRRVVCTSWYSQRVDGLDKGSRLTFVDLSDRERPRYRHVLLVEPVVDEDGRAGVVPLKVHAGGIVWHGRYLHVAATWRGIYCFRLDDILRVFTGGDPRRLHVHGDGRVDSFGYRYVLPVRFRYDALADPGHEPMRYSFLSLDSSSHPHRLVVGEYGERGTPARLAVFELDPGTALPRADENGHARPVEFHETGIRAMQGAAAVDGTYFVTASAGRHGRGSLWVGRPGVFRRYPHVLPVGPEAIAFWPATGQLWSLTEYPGRRYVFAMTRSDFG